MARRKGLYTTHIDEVEPRPIRSRVGTRNTLTGLSGFKLRYIVVAGTIIVLGALTTTVGNPFSDDRTEPIPSAAVNSNEYFEIPQSFNIPSTLPEHPGVCSDLESIVNHRDGTVTDDERKSALRENTSIVMYVTGTDYDSIDSRLSISKHTFHSALRISESGYFITQASGVMNFLNNPETKNGLVLVYHPGSEQFYMVREIAQYPERDIVFLNGTTGIPALPIRGIEFRKTPIGDREELYMSPPAIERQQRSNNQFADVVYFRDTRSGSAVSSNRVLNTDPRNKPRYTDQLTILGMQILSGENGLHIFDKNGKIVGITTKELEITAPDGLYDGTQIASTQSIGLLARNCYDNRKPLPLRFEFSRSIPNS